MCCGGGTRSGSLEKRKIIFCAFLTADDCHYDINVHQIDLSWRELGKMTPFTSNEPLLAIIAQSSENWCTPFFKAQWFFFMLSVHFLIIPRFFYPPQFGMHTLTYRVRIWNMQSVQLLLTTIVDCFMMMLALTFLRSKRDHP